LIYTPIFFFPRGPSTSSSSRSHSSDCGPAARNSKTAKMSGYQGKKNIPRITVSL
ncbi:unnamed protein product, partial [Tetraodon nigroviridis]